MESEGIRQAFESVDNFSLYKQIHSIIEEINKVETSTVNPQMALEEMRGKLFISSDISQLLGCSIEHVPSEIIRVLKLPKEKIKNLDISDYKEALAQINFHKLIGETEKTTGRKKSNTNKSNSPKQRGKAQSRKKSPVSSPMISSSSTRPSASSSYSKTISGSSSGATSASSAMSPAASLKAEQLRAGLCGKLFNRDLAYKIHPRVARWLTKDPKEIRLFTDKDTATQAIVNKYANYNDPKINYFRARHHLPGFDKIMSHPNFKNAYCLETQKGPAFWVEFNYGDKVETGLVYLGIDKSTIYHCYFEPVDESDEVVDLINPSFPALNISDEVIEDGYINAPPYEFSLDLNYILNVRYPEEKHFLRIFPVNKTPLEQMYKQLEAGLR